jgi:uncharacterized membrane protein
MNLDAPHLHLMINHLPVLGVPFALGLGAAGLLLRRDVLARAALVTLVLAGPATWATQWTGEEAEEIVEKLPGVSHELIHDHEEAGEGATTGSMVLGGIALALLVYARRRPVPRVAQAVVLLLGLLMAGWLAYTATLGGEIRHPEIRRGFQAGSVAPHDLSDPASSG